MVSANINKAIKISKARRVVIDNCEFDASKLDARVDNQGAYIARSLAAINIQEQNGAQGTMTISIKNCIFKDTTQGSIENVVADMDTAGAIKIKKEKAARSSGFL